MGELKNEVDRRSVEVERKSVCMVMTGVGRGRSMVLSCTVGLEEKLVAVMLAVKQLQSFKKPPPLGCRATTV